MMGQEFRYPSFNISGKNKVHFDGSWSEKTIGITAEVTPKVSEKGTISTNFMIELKEFQGFSTIEKGTTVTFSDNFKDTFPQTSSDDPLIPIFSTRRMKTEIDSNKQEGVIYLKKPE